MRTLTSGSSRGAHPARLAMALPALLFASPAWAEDLPATSRIEAVTVFPEGALVSRRIDLDIPAGAHTIVLKDMPQKLDVDSLQISGAGTGKLSLGTLELRKTAAEPSKPGGETEQKLKALQAEFRRVAGVVEAEDAKKKMVERFAAAGPVLQGGDGKPAFLPLDQWAGAWQSVGAALAASNEALRQGRAEQERLRAEIAALEAISQPKSGTQPRPELVVAVEAAQAGKASLQVSYRISGAGWRPIYDANLGTAAAAPELSLEKRAIITQRTGETWADVALTLSTARVDRGTQSPAVPGAKIAYLAPPVVRRSRAADSMMMEGAVSGRAEMPAAAPRPAPAPVAAEPKMEVAEREEAQVETGAFQAEYRIPGKVTVTSDGAEKGVALGAAQVSAGIVMRTAPVLDPTVYLEAEVKNEGEEPLLPGEVMLRRDGVFIGRGRIDLIAGGDVATLGFGATDKVRIKRLPVKQQDNEPGLLGSTRSRVSTFRTVAKNLHAFPVSLQIIDRLPYSEDNTITVETLSGTTAPHVNGVKDKRGVFGWNATLKPQEEKAFSLAYRIRWPAERQIRTLDQ